VLGGYADILPRLKPRGVLNVAEHSSRASVRGISAPFVHISFCVRAIIVKVLCLNATLPPYDQRSLKKELNDCAALSYQSVHNPYYYGFCDYINVVVK